MAEDNSHPEGKKEKKTTNSESAAKEIKDGISAATNVAVGTAAVGASASLFGLDGLVTALSFPLGGMVEQKIRADGKGQFTSKNLRDESIAGALFTPALWYTVKTIQNVPKAYGLDGIVNMLGASIPASALAIGGLSLASIPLLNALYYPIKYLADKKTFSGIGKDFQKNYWSGTRRSLIYLGLPTAAAVAASSTLPLLAPYLFPILAGLEIAYRIVLSKEKLDYSKLLNPLAYLPNFANPFYLGSGAASLAGKTFRGTASAAYGMGSSLNSLITKLFAAPASAPKSGPAAPAH